MGPDGIPATLRDFRRKFPQYDGVPDETLAGRLHAKFYAGKVDLPTFRARFLGTPEPAPALSSPRPEPAPAVSPPRPVTFADLVPAASPAGAPAPSAERGVPGLRGPLNAMGRAWVEGGEAIGHGAERLLSHQPFKALLGGGEEMNPERLEALRRWQRLFGMGLLLEINRRDGER